MRLLQPRIQPIRSGWKRIARIGWQHEADKTIAPELRVLPPEIDGLYYALDCALAVSSLGRELFRMQQLVEADILHSLAMPPLAMPHEVTVLGVRFESIARRSRPVEVPLSDERVMIQQCGSYTRSMVRNDARATSEVLAKL